MYGTLHRLISCNFGKGTDESECENCWIRWKLTATVEAGREKKARIKSYWDRKMLVRKTTKKSSNPPAVIGTNDGNRPLNCQKLEATRKWRQKIDSSTGFFSTFDSRYEPKYMITKVTNIPPYCVHWRLCFQWSQSLKSFRSLFEVLHLSFQLLHSLAMSFGLCLLICHSQGALIVIAVEICGSQLDRPRNWARSLKAY
jgi:hypothetical protein